MFCTTSESSEGVKVALFLFYEDPCYHDTDSAPLHLKACAFLQSGLKHVRGTLIVHPHTVLSGFLSYQFGYHFDTEDGRRFVLDFAELKQTNELLLQYSAVCEVHPGMGPQMSSDPENPVTFEVLDQDLFPNTETPGVKMFQFWISTLSLLYAEVTHIVIKAIKGEDVTLGVEPKLPSDKTNVFWMWFPDCKPRRLSSWLSHMSSRSYSIDETRHLVQVSPMSSGFYLVKVVSDKDDLYIEMHDTANTKLEVYLETEAPQLGGVKGVEDFDFAIERSRLSFNYDFALNFDEGYTSDFGFHREVPTRVFLFPDYETLPFQGIRADSRKTLAWKEEALSSLQTNPKLDAFKRMTLPGLHCDSLAIRRQYMNLFEK